MYKIGDKVETPLGVAVVIFLGDYTVFVNINGKELQFDKVVVKPYTSAHDKLIALGYQVRWESVNLMTYQHDTLNPKYIDIDKLLKTWEVHNARVTKVSCEVDLKISRILTQYLEELE